MNKIQCYAPKNEAGEEMKDGFWGRFQSIPVKYSEKDLTVLIAVDTRRGWERRGGQAGRGDPWGDQDISAPHLEISLVVHLIHIIVHHIRSSSHQE